MCLEREAELPPATWPNGHERHAQVARNVRVWGRGLGQLELICAQHGFLSKPGCILFYRHSQMGCGRRGGGKRCGAGVGPMVVHDLTARGAQTLMVRWFVVIPIAGGKGGGSNACAEKKGWGVARTSCWFGTEREMRRHRRRESVRRAVHLSGRGEW